MPRAATKQELLDSIESEYRLLKQTIQGLAEEEMKLPGVCHKWSPKDVMAHLVEWKKMFLGWYERGLHGGTPRRPADDLNWGQLPALNERIYQKWKTASLRKVLRELEATYQQMLDLTRSLPEDQLFRKELYPWMRIWPLSMWIAANTSSHYRWARTRIGKWANLRKRRPQPAAR